jgi:glycosyltransferase involved in cell wall biosynthesis
MTQLISIIMGYYNRKSQLSFTLETILIQYNKYKHNLEVIIVDDGSDKQHHLNDMISNYPFPIKLIVINKEDKSWMNPVISYNVGIENASGDIIIFQNPEVCHIGDVIQYTLENINDENYIVYSVYSMKSFQDNLLIVKEYKQNGMDFLLEKYKNKPYHKEYDWYSHTVYQNRRYHFLSAMTRKTLERIGGFDPDFYDGYCYDDDDFRNRIEKVVKSITINPEKVMGIHLFHESAAKFSSSQALNYYLDLNRKRMMKNIENNVIFCDINKITSKYQVYKNY